MNKKVLHQFLFRHLLKKCAVCLMFIPVFISAEEMRIAFAYVGPEHHGALLGAQQGLAEANLQGQFLNQKYTLDILPVTHIDSHDFSDYLAILLSVDADSLQKLAKKFPSKPIFNVLLEDDFLRKYCTNNVLHILPSNAMKKDAEAQWQKKHPDSKAIAQAWDPDFVKFAARDLNKRFKKKHNTEMDDYAWAGWAAIKLTSDTVARIKTVSSREVLDYLKNKLIFDGQKGVDMNFRETGQLRQPVLLVENNKILSEAPIRGIANPPTLDSLGILKCEKRIN